MRPGDLELLQRILNARGGFSHREHVELAWTYLREYPTGAAEQAMTEAIRHVAELHGTPDRYHETITRSWVKLVAVHHRGSPADSFDEFIAANPGLLDRHLLSRHYSGEVLRSQAARHQWREPDIAALPASLGPR